MTTSINYLNWSINKEIRKLDFCGPECHLRESTIFGIPIKFPTQRKKKILKSVQKQRNYALIKNARIVMFKIALGGILYTARGAQPPPPYF